MMKRLSFLMPAILSKSPEGRYHILFYFKEVQPKQKKPMLQQTGCMVDTDNINSSHSHVHLVQVFFFCSSILVVFCHRLLRFLNPSILASSSFTSAAVLLRNK